MICVNTGAGHGHFGGLGKILGVHPNHPTAPPCEAYTPAENFVLDLLQTIQFPANQRAFY